MFGRLLGLLQHVFVSAVFSCYDIVSLRGVDVCIIVL